MKRSKRLYLLGVMLVVICGVTFGVSRYEQYKEEIKNSDESILTISADEVTAFSWEYDQTKLAFHKDGTWQYDDDGDFPVSEEKVEELLGIFASFEVAFTIENVEDYAQYGLDKPTCSIRIETKEETYEIQLGDYSVMDEQRYVSIDDGNVYLAASDPMESYEIELKDMIQNDEIPVLEQADRIVFAGNENYSIAYQENSDATYNEEDVYFAEEDDGDLPLDTDTVKNYLTTISNLELSNYVSYHATEEELETYGLDNPELTVTLQYTADESDDDSAQTTDESQTFEMRISHSLKDQEKESDADADTEESIPAYVRIGESQIIYEITGTEYDALMAASSDKLRHQEIFWGDFDHVTQVDVSLEGENYQLTTEKKKGEYVWYYEGDEVDINEFQTALGYLTATEFTEDEADGKEEISLTLHLEDENFPTVQINLYRHDGTSCIATVDGKPTALVARSDMIDLVEAVNAIVLNSSSNE